MTPHELAVSRYQDGLLLGRLLLALAVIVVVLAIVAYRRRDRIVASLDNGFIGTLAAFVRLRRKIKSKADETRRRVNDRAEH